MSEQKTTILATSLEQQGQKKTRKASDPFIIPWEDGEAFKLTTEYLATFVTADELAKYKKEYFYSYNDRYDVGTETLSFNASTSKGWHIISCHIGGENLSVKCTCKSRNDGICSHAWVSLYTLTSRYGSQYFKRFRNPAIEKLSLAQRDILLVSVNRDGIRFRAHENFGRLFGFYNGNERFYENHHPIVLQEKAIQHEKTLVYGIPDDGISFPEPILIPFYAIENPKRSIKRPFIAFDKSFIFNGNGQMRDGHTFNQTLINTLCQEMVNVSMAWQSVLETRFEVSEKKPRHEPSEHEYKNHLLFKYWNALLPLLKDEYILAYESTYRNPAITRPQNRLSFKIRLTDQNPAISCVLTDKETHVEFRLKIQVDNEVLDKPTSFPHSSGFFISTGNGNDYTIVRSLRDAEIIRQFARANYCISVLPEDFQKFKEEILNSIVEHYPITVERTDGDASFFLVEEPLAVSRSCVHISRQGDDITLKPTIVYGDNHHVNLISHGNPIFRSAGKREKVYLRHADKELKFKTMMQSLHAQLAVQTDCGQYRIPFPLVQKGKWLIEAIETLKEKGIEVSGVDKLEGFEFNPNQLEWNMQIKGDCDWFDIAFDIKFGDQQLSPAHLKSMVKNPGGYVYLPDGSVGQIPSAIQKKWIPLFQLGEATERGLRLSSKHFTTIRTFAGKISEPKIKERIKQQRQKLQSLDKIQPLPKPETVQAVLRPYQEMGFSWMGFLREFGWGGILADDMGLGKTLQVLTLLDYHYQQTPEAPASLIVVPNSLLFNWQQEVQKFTPHRQVLVHHGTNRDAQLDCEAGQLVLTTYGTLIWDIEMLQTQRFSYLVLDESQAIKNPLSKRFECAQAIQSDYRLALTGTPIENGIADLFAQLDFVNPGFLGTYGQFKKNFPGIADGTASSETKESLQRIIAPFMLRRTKAQVAKDLPEKTEMILYCDMLPEQRKIYERYRRYFRGELEGKVSEGMDKAKFFVLEGLMKLRQVCNSPSLIKSENLPNVSAKLDEMKEHILEKTQGHKLLVFSSFTAMLALMKTELEGLGISYAYLDGKVPGDQRQAEVARFQNDETCRVFLISLKAGGTGLNLTAADYVYILDPWWNPAAEAQAIDRCYRIGQDKHVMAYRMICKDSIEEKILNMQASKKELADSLIQTDGSVLKALNKDDLLRLFD
ncbi:DEAD/DEAH box helicase [Parapedobacter tibetensis]|uniref:DEAD/DEAH box helicase n=1 Tax=Parapedobacter tibetensis TaxID=2972951 RepID=UPI00214D87F1|nr:DEAD/DEAH box helicase [Parapedobacter tibetensis]